MRGHLLKNENIMAQTIVLRTGGAKGLTLLQTKALENLDPSVLKANYQKGRRSLVVRKVQVGNPIGDPAFVLGDAVPWTGFKGNISQFASAFPKPARGLQNAVTTVRNASRSYSKGRGLTSVGGIVYTRWQAFLQTGKYDHAGTSTRSMMAATA
jgi:hypothetical protein